ncbi:uncharacterized protein B0I36DRAFT_364337 [Microdochium trichocladiopsis]|uniref:Uncharacterized protein n=1 Tax=Microdochium trichocladiopsis TaxID=1682393 RepID=A0A9P8Y3I4_9PEZI|nr:uncharacterized protein B0I36DRAFT_364337 [Microdochium trichocladiopsis]KAH7029864.1 hypothetical protein B0I36DRAFT_364337 [Microdochium trichocladiopsis]
MHTSLISTVAVLALGVSGASAYYTKVDRVDDGVMTTQKMRDSGYELKDWWNLVDSAMESICDSNGCYGSIEKCDNAFCINIDGDNGTKDPGNIQKVVGDFIKEMMETESIVDDGCTATGCAFADATRYTIPAHISLARFISTGPEKDMQQGLYKITITGADDTGACEDVFDAVSSVAGLLSAGSLLGAVKIFAC